MKNSILLFILLLSSGLLFSQIVNIPDPVFKSRLIEEGVDTNNDGEIQESEALAVTDLDVLAYASEPKIGSLEGIQYFTNLVSLDFSRNLITSFDASIYPNLDYLRAYGNNLNSINLNGLDDLTFLHLNNNNLTNVNLNSLVNLDILFLGNNNLLDVDLSSLINLTVFECRNCGLTSVDFQQNSILDEISIKDNSISALNFSDLPLLRILFMDNNLFTELDLTNANNILWVECSENAIETVNVNGLSNLASLNISNNNLNEIDCSNSPVTFLNCSNNPNLSYINVQNGFSQNPDPDLLYFPLYFYDLPNLESICMDPEDWDSLIYSGYNPDNVTVFTGPDCTLSINEFSLSKTYIYPNPVSNSFTIQSNTEITSYSLHDITGKLIINTNKEDQLKSNISFLNSGIYFLTLESASGNQKIIRLLKK